MKRTTAMVLLLLWTIEANETSVEARGKEILKKADQCLLPTEAIYELAVGTIEDGSRKLENKMQLYKKGYTKSTSIHVYPKVMENVVSMRVGNTFYYKPLKAFKPEVYSYRSIFLNSGLSWADILAINLVDDYKTESIDTVEEFGAECLVLKLKPIGEDKYARIDVWIDNKNARTYQRLYYTASGDEMKRSLFSGFEEEKGKVVSFIIEMEDLFLGSKYFIEYSEIEQKKLPAFLFDVNSIGRIHKR